MCDHGGQRKRKGWPRAPRPARLKTKLYLECLTLDHPECLALRDRSHWSGSAVISEVHAIEYVQGRFFGCMSNFTPRTGANLSESYRRR